MLSRLLNAFTPSTIPSALLVLGEFGSTIHVLHLLPESSINERFSITTSSSATAFHRNGATEQAREQIGTVTLHVGDGETADSFLDDVETRIRELRADSSSLSPAQQQTGTDDRIKLLLCDHRVVNKALQNLGAESLAVINYKIKGPALSRCPALHVKHGVSERKPRGDLD
ncbi:hypothetical protein NHJ13734_009148 [Beauveria thailandica]